MQLLCDARRRFAVPPPAVFALVVDPRRFPACFTGCGPIPAIDSISLDGPLAVDSRRRIVNGDGSELLERVTRHAEPWQHAYTLAGFRPPFAWLLRGADAEWQLGEADDGCEVRWIYRFELRHPLLALPAWPALLFMRRAMAVCLRRMAQTLADPARARA